MKAQKGIWFCLVAVLALGLQSPAQETALLPHSVVQAIIEEVSGELAVQNEWMLAPFERNRPEAEYTGRLWESEYMVRKAVEYGLQDVHVETFWVEGEKQWDGVKGNLWLLEPEKKTLASYDEIAASLAPESETADVTADLVLVSGGDSPKDYDGVDVKGKIVLVTGDLRRAHTLAVIEKGARGVVYYNASPALEFPEMVPWTDLDRDSVKKAAAPSFGFILTPKMGKYLADRLIKGERLVVRAETEAKFYPKKLEVVTALIPGTDPAGPEFLFVAHLYEGLAKQGANDNISGCVCELEVGRTIVKLQKEGKIPPLKRSIRFIWVPEIEGTDAYLRRFPEEKARIAAGINMDMVGEGLTKCHTIFRVSRSPDSLPHFMNDVVQEMAELTVKLNNDANSEYPGNVYGQFSNRIVSPQGSRDVFNLYMLGYDGGSDNVILNSWAFGVPTVYLECWPDDFYHTNMDTPDKSDSTQLKRVAFIATASAAAFCSATPPDVLNFAVETLCRAEGRIEGKVKVDLALLSSSSAENLYESYKNAHFGLIQSYRREVESLRTIQMLAGNDGPASALLRRLITGFESKEKLDLDKIRILYERLCTRHGQSPQGLQLSEAEQRLSRMIPERTGEGRKHADIPETNKVAGLNYGSYETFNFIDGKRSILDIAHALFSEYGVVSPADMEEFIQAQVKAGNLKLRESGSLQKPVGGKKG
jgi:Peptidase family M28/PA domain